MAVPRVFISSTYYDLKYVRENLEFLVRNMGFEPVLSERGSVYYDHEKEVRDSCVADVTTCQMLVLIIGGRRGSHHTDGERSVVNAEYEAAVSRGIPVFALVEESVLQEHRVYVSNANNPNIAADAINYPSVDSTDVFDFITEVQAAAANNALQPFGDFADIQDYLRAQWAGLMYRYLNESAEARRVQDTLTEIRMLNERMDYLTRQIISASEQRLPKVSLKAWELIQKFESVRKATDTGVPVTPQDVLAHPEFADLLEAIGVRVVLPDEDDDDTRNFWGKGFMSMATFRDLRSNYGIAVNELRSFLGDQGMADDEFLADYSGPTARVEDGFSPYRRDVPWSKLRGNLTPSGAKSKLRQRGRAAVVEPSDN